MRHRPVACVLAALVIAATETYAQDATPTFSVRTSFKSTGLFARSPDDPFLFSDRDAADGLWRIRVEPTIGLNDDVNVEFAVEQRVRAFSSQSGLSAILPSEADAPFRIRQLDWQLATGDNGEWRLEVDRAAVHLKSGAASFTLGRQAIGWGRGALFSAVDLFSPFSPLEADREWRRGVDAARAEVKLAAHVSVDGVAAFASDIDHAAFAARLRGYAGKADVEVVGGRRARDNFAGATTSAVVGGAEAHGEVAVFDTPDEGVVTKVVAGGSYRFAVGTGILLYLEYHFSGFGAASAAEIIPRLSDPAFQERYLRGDTQILGRHAVAALASYEFSPEWSTAIEWLQSPTDGSGIVVPSAVLTLGDRSSMFASVYVPYGRAPTGPVLASEFGASPLAAFVQFRFYR